MTIPHRKISMEVAKVSRVQKAKAFMQREPKLRTAAAVLATMRLLPNANIPTARTDSLTTVQINYDWAEQYSTEEVAAVLLHETMHKVGFFPVRFDNWMARYPGYDRKEMMTIFNVAHDFLINHNIKHDWGLPLPPGGLYDPRIDMRKTTVESLADQIVAGQHPGNGGHGTNPGKGGQGKPDDSQQGGEGEGESNQDPSDNEGEGGSGDAGDGGDQDSNQTGGSGGGKGEDDTEQDGEGGGGSGNDQSEGEGEGNDTSGESESKEDTHDQKSEGGEGGLSDGCDVYEPEPDFTEKPMSEAEKQRIMAETRRDLATAMRAAQGCGKGNDPLTQVLAAATTQAPTASLRRELALLARNLDKSGHTSWLSPNRRRVLPNGFRAPGPRDTKLGLVVLAIDTSGSTSGSTVKYFLNTAQETLRNSVFNRVIIIHCDDHIRHIDDWTKEEFMRQEFTTRVYGGGGTEIMPPFQWLEENNLKPDAMVYFTDGGVWHGDVAQVSRHWKRRRFPLLWALWGYGAETFINWVTVNDRVGKCCMLPADKW